MLDVNDISKIANYFQSKKNGLLLRCLLSIKASEVDALLVAERLPVQAQNTVVTKEVLEARTDKNKYILFVWVLYVSPGRSWTG
jgi:hypothetical protein